MDRVDVAVVGGGHAGCEAALASARMGARTVLFSLNIDHLAQMSCNPAIGGVAKGQLVREVDALGGEMARAIDETGIHFRWLNKKRGPALWSLRAQADKLQYQRRMRRAVERQAGLVLKQDEVTDLVVERGRVAGLRTLAGAHYACRAVVIAPGTFLNGTIHIGMRSFPGGRSGEVGAASLSKALAGVGLALGRLKTGTPPRVNGRGVDFSKLETQNGDDPPSPFSHFTERITQECIPCYITHTTERTHEIIRANLKRSALYSGRIVGVGPRYCPSVEDKVVRFAAKGSHAVFVEPEGRDTAEFYLNGLATSLDEEVQAEVLRSIPGLEHAEIMRPGYAVEYDFVPPTQIWHTLETKAVEGLFLAGQINGTSGYEEASGQGIVAGINAAAGVLGKDPLVLARSEAYIGVLIDDLVTKGTEEPYRMFTSRAEYRLLLRHDNADERLMPHGVRYGLVPREALARVEERKRQVREETDRLGRTFVPPSVLRRRPDLVGDGEFDSGVSLAKLLARPEMDYRGLEPLDSDRRSLPEDVVFRVEIDLKYEGYIKRQERAIAEAARLEKKRIPRDLNFMEISEISFESREKLTRIRPESLLEASRISGVSPADVAGLWIHLEKRARVSAPEVV